MNRLESKPLGEIAELVVVGYVGPSSEHFCDHGIPYLRTGNVGRREILREGLIAVTDTFHKSQKKSQLKAGDVVVTRVISDAVNCSIIPPDLEGANCGNIIIIRPGKNLDPSYITHLLSSRESQNFLISRQVGSAQSVINTSVLKAWEIPVLPIAEQRRISAILDQSDALRAKRREALAQLDELQQAIFIEMFGDPATNPKGFATKKLGELIKFEGGAQPPASTFSDTGGPDKIRLVQIRDFKTDRFKTFIPRALARRFFESDDVMIGRYGPPVFQILRGLSGSYNVALMKAVPREGITKEFVFHLLKEERLHNFVVANSERTAGQSGVNLDLLEAYDAYLPPLQLQIEFGNQMSTLASLRKRMEEANQEIDTLFSSLQHRAFRGEL